MRRRLTRTRKKKRRTRKTTTEIDSFEPAHIHQRKKNWHSVGCLDFCLKTVDLLFVAYYARTVNSEMCQK